MNGFQFHDPVWFSLLIPVLILLRWFRPARHGLPLTPTESVDRLPIGGQVWIRRQLPRAQTVVWLLLIIVLARPQKGLEEYRVRTEGIAIAMCLDRSGSMRTADFELDGNLVTRLDAVKEVFRRFVMGDEGLDGRPDDLIGLITFGGFAENLCPLTLDHGVLTEVIEQVQFPRPIRDEQGRIINRELLMLDQATAIGDGVAAGVDRLRSIDAASKVLILLSDGENTAGVLTPEQAAEIAESSNIRVYSIGVAGNSAMLARQADPFGLSILSPQRTELDESTLQMLAGRTGGRYFRADDTETLQQVYAEIDELEKTETEGLTYRRHAELYEPFLWAAILFLMGEFILSSSWFLTVP